MGDIIESVFQLDVSGEIPHFVHRGQRKGCDDQ